MTDDTKLTDCKVSGFDTITTYRYEGFTERLVSEFERILNNLQNSAEVNNIIEFYTKLQEHIASNSAHDMNLSVLSDELIAQLYRTYRKAGYTESRADMILALDKQITSGTDVEANAGISQDKPMSAKQWKPIFDRHTTSKAAHYKLYNTLNPDKSFNVVPSVYSDSTVITITDDKVNPTQGTVTAKFKVAVSRPFTIMNVSFLNDNIAVFSLVAELNNGTINIVTNKGTYALSCGISSDVILTNDTLVVSYAASSISIYNMLNGIDIPDLPTYTQVKITIDGNRSGNTQSSAYYPVAADEDEIRFLLN